MFFAKTKNINGKSRVKKTLNGEIKPLTGSTTLPTKYFIIHFK